MEIGRTEILPVVAFEKGRAPLARVISRATTLYLHHVRAEIGEQLSAPRTGKNAG